RDDLVTGVQTCALPISVINAHRPADKRGARIAVKKRDLPNQFRIETCDLGDIIWCVLFDRCRKLLESGGVFRDVLMVDEPGLDRSEERRVGKECEYRMT